jgi:hypothetical protein
LKNFVGFSKHSEFVMPDLIRYPESAEVTGFRPSPEGRFKDILTFTTSSSFFLDQTGRFSGQRLR